MSFSASRNSLGPQYLTSFTHRTCTCDLVSSWNPRSIYLFWIAKICKGEGKELQLPGRCMISETGNISTLKVQWFCSCQGLTARVPKARSKKHKGRTSCAPQTQHLTPAWSWEHMLPDSCLEGAFNSVRKLDSRLPMFFYIWIQNCMKEESIFFVQSSHAFLIFFLCVCDGNNNGMNLKNGKVRGRVHYT